ncbi:MAG: response regulator [Planctomycetes bacterium]|nr:response regulator [Planctomycetota bacterium]
MARILVVDDSEAIAVFLAETLEAQGYSVRTVTSGEEAIYAVNEEAFDLAVVDVRMPRVGGPDVVRFINRGRFCHQEEFRRIPVILLTDGDEEEIPEGIEYHATLRKPFVVGELLVKVENAVGPEVPEAEKTRRYVRRHVRLPVEVRIDAQRFRYHTVNIGLGGVQLEWDRCPFCSVPRQAARDISAGTADRRALHDRCRSGKYRYRRAGTRSILARIQTQEGVLEIPAKLVYHVPCSAQDLTSGPAGHERAGFAFTQVTVAHMDLIERLCDPEGTAAPTR